MGITYPDWAAPFSAGSSQPPEAETQGLEHGGQLASPVFVPIYERVRLLALTERQNINIGVNLSNRKRTPELRL